MNRKTLFKLVVDCLMVSSVLLAIANKLTENTMHELIGVFMILLLLLHNVLNRRWYASILQRRQSLRGVFDIAVTLLLFMVIGTLIGSSIMVSRMLFAFWDMEGNLTMRQIHTTAAHWLLVLMSIHLGMHWARLMGVLRKIVPIQSRQRVHVVFRSLLSLVVLVYGVKASFESDICAKLFMIHAFDSWNMDRSAAVFFLNYSAIIGASVVITDTILNVSRYRHNFAQKIGWKS